MTAVSYNLSAMADTDLRKVLAENVASILSKAQLDPKNFGDGKIGVFVDSIVEGVGVLSEYFVTSKDASAKRIQAQKCLLNIVAAAKEISVAKNSMSDLSSENLKHVIREVLEEKSEDQLSFSQIVKQQKSAGRVSGVGVTVSKKPKVYKTVLSVP